MTVGTIALSTVGAFNPFDMRDRPQAPGTDEIAWGTANLARGGWFVVPETVTVDGIYHFGNAIFGAGNVDKGIYDMAGNLIVSTGSITATTVGTGACFGSIASTVLTPGLYYLAIACSNASYRVYGWATASTIQNSIAGAKQAASSFPLPDPITWVNGTNLIAAVPILGLRVASGGDSGTYQIFDPPTIDMRHSFSGSGFGYITGTSISTTNTAAWTANDAIDYDFVIHGPDDWSCAYAYWINASTGLAGNIEVGIYEYGGARNLLASTGAVAQSGANALQTPALAVDLPPGRYRLAIASSSTSRFLGFTATQINAIRNLAGSSKMSSAYPLPSTWTAGGVPAAAVPIIGISSVAL